MDKNRNIDKYIDTVKENGDFFKQYYYHSLIDLNLIKLDTIMQHGILSKELIECNKLPNIYTHSSYDFDSKNGNSFISLTEYTDDCRFSQMFESFPYHTMTTLSLMIDKEIVISKTGEKETYFDDEIFCYQKVDKSKIKGIILPEHLSNLKINEVNCLANDYYCFTRGYINNWLKCTEDYFGIKIPVYYIDELKVSYAQLCEIIKEFGSPEKWIATIIKRQREKYGKDIKDVLANILQYLWSLKYDIENPKYIDVIMLLNKDNLPVYEIKEKCLRKIN